MGQCYRGLRPSAAVGLVWACCLAGCQQAPPCPTPPGSVLTLGQDPAPVLDCRHVADVQVAMGPNVWIRSAEASVQLGGSIGLEPAAPGPGVAEGQVALRGRLVTQRGTYRLNIGAFTRAFELEQGSVQFTG